MDIGDLTFENRLGREDIGDITLISYNSDDMYTIRMESKFANGKYTGTAPVTTFISDLKDMTAKKEMPALFADSTYVWKGNRYDLNFRCSNSMNLLSFIMPGLYIDAGTELKASLDKEGTVKAELVSDRLAYGHNYLKGLKASFSNADDKLGGAVECDVIKLSSIVMNNSRMNLHAKDNSIGLKYAYDNPGEEVNRGELLLHGKLSRNDDSVETQIDILPSSIYLNSKQWKFEKSSISIKPDNIDVPSFGLVSGEERISLSGKVSRERRDTLTLDLERFDISALNDLIKSDMRLKGHTSGKAQLISPLKEKGILADIICDSTYIADLPLGVLSIGSRWNEEEQNFGIYARNSLNGRNNLDFSGTLAPKGSILDGTVLLDMMEVGYVQPVVADIFSDIKGNVSGRIDLKGQLSNLEISSKDTYLNDGLLKIEYTNVPYHAEDVGRLVLLGQYNNYLDALFAIPTGAIQQRNPTVKLAGNHLGYFFMLLGEDEELDGLSVTVHYIVDDDTHHEQYAESEQYAFPVVEDKITRGDNDDITIHHQSAQRYILVFVDNPCKNIRTSCTTVVNEYKADTKTKQAGTYDTSHEFLSGTQQ